MALDVYAPCPCGSNKKLKFCCHGLEGSIEQVVRHQSAKQYKQALQLLDALDRKHPQSAWVKNLQAFTLMMDKRGPEAIGPLTKVLQVQPDNLYSIALFGLASFLGSGWKAGKTAIQRAFQRCSNEYPHIIYFLARSIAEFMGSIGSPLAHRQYLGLAMRLASEENRENVFMELIEFDGDTKIPYILRGSHDLVPVAGDEAFEKEVRKSAKLAFLGCNEAAAGLFAKLAETAESELAGLSGDDAAKKRVAVASLWWNSGLCRAWDGDEKAAAEALHRSAKHSDDFEAAVEAETLAQTLGRRGDRENAHRVVQATFKIKLVSKLLTLLDATPLFVRVPQPEGQAPDPRQPVATYRVLDKNPVTGNDSASYTLDSVPRVAAEIVVFASAAQGQQEAALAIIGIEGETFTDSLAKLEAAGGEELEKLTAPGSTESISTNSVFEKEFLPLQFKRHFEASTPLGIIRRINRDNWSKFLTSDWPEMPLAALGGKTPKQAIGDDSVRVPLAAWLQQIDMYADRFGLPFDVPAERAKYQLPDATPLEINEQTNVGTLSVLQFARVPFEKLSDQQLVAAFKRAALIQHKGSLRPLLLTIVERTSCHAQLDMSRVYRFLADLGSLLMETSEAVRWLDKERSRTVSATEQFEHDLDCDMRELRYRLDDPHDPACSNLLRRMWEHYGTKVPELRGYVTGIVSHYKISAPWMTDGEAVGAISSGGVWTPDSAAEKPAGESKLWLPGS
jgi:tetratricopeptide (TPR) repeat protein